MGRSAAARARVASLHWALPSELHSVQGEVVEALGYRHAFFAHDAAIPEDCDIVLVQGPYGSLSPLVRQLRSRPPARRPMLAYWFQQSLELRPPRFLRQLFGRLRSDLRHASNRLGGIRPHWLSRLGGTRLGYWGDLQWLHQQGLLDVLALSSTYYQRQLAGAGIPSIVVPRGFHASYGRLLNIERDIAVTWMGKVRSGRRVRAIQSLQDALAARGEVFEVRDGTRHPFVYGDERTELLNRTRFVLNLMPNPDAELSIRYYFAAANGAVILTEPSPHDYPFRPGEHFVESPAEAMPDRVAYYLDHEDERQAMARRMLALMQSELTLERSVASILGEAERALQRRRGAANA